MSSIAAEKLYEYTLQIWGVGSVDFSTGKINVSASDGIAAGTRVSRSPLRRHGPSEDEGRTRGGFAAIAQGVDLPMTDLDIVPATDQTNKQRLVACLAELGPQERAGDEKKGIDERRARRETPIRL